MSKLVNQFNEKRYTAAHNAREQLQALLYSSLSQNATDTMSSNSYISLGKALRRLGRETGDKSVIKLYRQLITSHERKRSNLFFKNEQSVINEKVAKKLANRIDQACSQADTTLEMALVEEGREHIPTVESFGTVGAGKTTTLKEVGKLWSGSGPWILDHNYKEYCTWKSNAGNAYDYLNRNTLFGSLLYQIIENKKSHSQAYDIKKFLRHESLYRVFTKNGKAIKQNVKSCLVIDEGVIKHCGSTIRNTMDETAVKKLLMLPQMPKAYVCFDADVEEIVKRIQQRKKVNQTHESKDTDYLRARVQKLKAGVKETSEMIEKTDIPLLRVDANLPPEENAMRIKKFLDEQCS